MTKIKFVSLILALLLTVSALSGCVLIKEDAFAMNNDVAFKVGGEPVTVGSFNLVFNNLYSQYQQYIQAGYYTVEQVFQLAVSQLVSTQAIISNYKKDLTTKTYEHDFVSFYNAKYLTKEEMEYILTLTKYSTYIAMDETINQVLAKDHTFIKEEEKTNREDEIFEIIESLSQQTHNTMPSLKAIKEYFSKGEQNYTADLNYEEYDSNFVFSDLSNPRLLALVEELNQKLDKTVESYKPITAQEYISAQRKALTNLRNTIDSNYGASMDQFVNRQINETITSVLATKIQQAYCYNKIEADKAVLLKDINNYWNTKKDTVTQEYLTNPDAYITAIEGLSEKTFVYDTASKYNYIYVKNLLIPFSATQSAEIKKYQTEVDALAIQAGETKEQFEARKDQAKAEFKLYLNQLAEQIYAKDFLTKDKDAQDQKFFIYDKATDKLIIDEESNLFKGFTDDKTIVKGLNQLASPKDFLDLMYRYNTDAGQHRAKYDYVVNVTDKDKLPEGYKAKWVEEFVEGAKDVYAKGIGNYSVVVSNYGVHIIYYTADVTPDQAHFTETKIYNTSTLEYRAYKAYYESVSNTLLQDLTRKTNKGIEIDLYSYMKKIVKQNGFKMPVF
ncbi:MAG: hypothetical protein RR248_01900 [Clostridia bacterium]